MKAMSVDKAKRFQTMEEMRVALARYLSARAGVAGFAEYADAGSHESSTGQLRTDTRRNPRSRGSHACAKYRAFGQISAHKSLIP